MNQREPIPDSFLMPFGKYKNVPIGQVPASYLDWLSGEYWLNTYPKVARYIRENRRHIDKELES